MLAFHERVSPRLGVPANSMRLRPPRFAAYNASSASRIGWSKLCGSPLSKPAIGLPDYTVYDGSPVCETGEIIRARQFLPQSTLSLNLAMEFNNATTHRHTGQEFTGVEGLGEIVICSGCQPADDVIFVCVASE